MKLLPRLSSFLVFLLLLTSLIPALPITRMNRSSLTLPVGTVLILEMETELHSGHTRASDRFTARVAESLLDTDGNVLVPEGSYVEGYVKAVMSAKMRRRAGMIEIVFDRLRMEDDRVLPLSGVLVNADTRTAKKIDEEEGTINGGTGSRRTVVVVGAGAVGAGATVGLITGSAILGAGVGAAAGVAGAFLAKGEEAVVYPGTVVGVELTQPLELGYGTGSTRDNSRYPASDRTRTREYPRHEGNERDEADENSSARRNASEVSSGEINARRNPVTRSAPPAVNKRDLRLEDEDMATERAGSNTKAKPQAMPAVPAPPQKKPAPVITEEPDEIPTLSKSGDPTLVKLSNFQLDRAKDGAVDLILKGETSSGGWRLYTTYATDRDLLQIWLHGDKPEGFATQMISHPTIRFRMPDAMRVLRRVVIHGANGSFRGEIPR